MAQAIFGLARHVIQKSQNQKKYIFEKFEAKMGSKLSLRFGGRKCVMMCGLLTPGHVVFTLWTA